MRPINDGERLLGDGEGSDTSYPEILVFDKHRGDSMMFTIQGLH
jgi:hypothetical protein